MQLDVLLIFFDRLELHEGIRVWLEVPYHVLFEQQIVGGRQVVVFVVLDRFEQTFSVEPLLSFKVGDNFLVKQVRSLHEGKRFATFLDDIRMRWLQSRWRHMEPRCLRLAEVVPGVLPDLVNCYTLVGVGNEDLIDHVACFF